MTATNRQEPRFDYDCFLSHNTADKARVRRLAQRLRDAGLKVWFDDWAIRPGDDIYLAIERGLEGSRVQVLCLSPAALGSDWVAMERSTVLFRDPGNAGRRFIPILLADCQLPDALRRYKYLDFRQESDGAFGELVIACRGAAAEVPIAEPTKPAANTDSKPIGRLLGKKGARKPREPQAKSEDKKRKPVVAQTEPLAVLERKLIGHTTWVNSVAVSPDGTWAASGSKDKTIRIWDLDKGTCRATLQEHTEDVLCLAISLDGQRLFSGSQDSTLKVWKQPDHTIAQSTIIHDATDTLWIYSIGLLPSALLRCHQDIVI